MGSFSIKPSAPNLQSLKQGFSNFGGANIQQQKPQQLAGALMQQAPMMQNAMATMQRTPPMPPPSAPASPINAALVQKMASGLPPKIGKY